MSISSISSFRMYSPWVARAAELVNQQTKEEALAAGRESKVQNDAINSVINSTTQAIDKEGKASKGSKSSVSSLPYAYIMHQLNLTPTGDISKDQNMTVSRLEELIRYTRDKGKLQQYLDLADKIGTAFTSAASINSKRSPSSLSGAEQIAQYNRVMLLNMKASS